MSSITPGANNRRIILPSVVNRAISTDLDKKSQDLCWTNIYTALATVFGVLLFGLPLWDAIITVANIAAIVVSAVGFIGYAGYSYNLLTLCVMHGCVMVA